MSHEPTVTNAALDRMQAGGLALGMILRIVRSGEVARIAKSAGYDFLFIDGQHGVFDIETINHLALAALGCGVAPIVRVRRYDDPNIPVLLDAGVLGIVVPDVNTPEQAKRAVELAKYAPIGKRSAGGGLVAFDYKPVPTGEIIRHLNRLTLVACMIETVEGLANVDAIAAVDGVDVLHVGCNDMLVDMGKPGAFGSPEILAAIGKVIRAAKAHGKFAGVGGDRDLGRQAKMIQDGVQFMTAQADAALLAAEAGRLSSALRQAAG
jgi:staphyloferrin B biosynthesis citrate synthase